MAAFQPLEFNYQLDPTLVQPPGSTFSLANGPGLGAGNPVTGDAASSSSLFSSLFGDGNIFSRNSMFGGTDRNTGISSMGWAPAALGVGQALFGALQGNRALKMAQDQFKESKRQFDLNFNAQRQSINTQLEDRQRARVASNPGAYQDVDSYLKKNKV